MSNLTVVTGTPGAGKTLNTLAEVRRKFRSDDNRDNWRPIFTWGIEGVDHDFFGSEELEDPHKWMDLPVGSVVIIDEAHEAFPLRMAGNQVPAGVEALAKVRHYGIDLFLLTQAAQDLDVFIRRRCTRHVHYSRVLGHEVAKMYEYSKYTADPEGFHEKRDAISVKPVKFPTDLYGKYKSAEIHTVKRRYPWRLFVLPIGLAGIVFFGWLAFTTLSRGGDDAPVDAGRPGFLSMPSAGRGRPVVPQTLEGFIAQFSPLVPGVPHSAPVYASLMEAQTWPKPHCILFDDGHQCRCLTQQMTQYETTDNICRHWAIEGFFDHTLERESVRVVDREGAGSANALRPSDRVVTGRATRLWRSDSGSVVSGPDRLPFERVAPNVFRGGHEPAEGYRDEPGG